MIFVILVVFFLFLFLGMPVSSVLGIAALIPIFLSPTMTWEIMVTRVFEGVNSFPLVAILFFIFLGQLFHKGDLMPIILRFSDLLVGRIRGGLAHINVVASMLFAGISGSGLADTATMGSVFIPVMKKEGYRLDFSTAITVTSSVIGPIIPPSIIMVIYAMIAQVSVGGLFLTGFVPGILLGGVLILGAYIISIRHGYKKREEKYSVKEALSIILSAVPLMIVSVIILGGIFSGAFTATESSFVAVLYTIIYLTAKRKINLRQLYLAAVETIEITAVLFLVIATANILSWVLANLQVQETIASVFRPIAHNKILLIIFYNTFFLITGCFLEAVPTIILFVPKLTPILVDAGFHPLHVGIMTVLPITFGMITPPVGVCLFVACGLTGLKLEKLVKAEIPFVLSEIGVLFLISFFPFLPLWPARLFGY